MTFQALEEELLTLFRRGVDEPLGEDAFNDLALRVFRFQYEANPIYRAFAHRRGGHPDAVDRWEAIPALPTRAFKTAPLVCGPAEAAEAVFRTSGTTRGREARGEHHVRSLALYRAALTPNFRAHLLPEGEALPVLALLPSPEEAPDSSLSFMVGEAVGWWEAGGVGDEGGGVPETGVQGGGSDTGSRAFFVDPEAGIRKEAFRGAALAAAEAPTPVLLAGTAFAFAQWLEIAREEDARVTLPPGSRIMETGGYKGRTRALSREALYDGMEEVFGVPPERVVNEYGMTELLSQFYEPVLVEDPSGSGGDTGPGTGPGTGTGAETGTGSAPERRFHRPPPWVRTVALHPMTLEPVPEGEAGILAHLDLANLGSVARILTGDLGRMVPGGFVLAGRSPGAEPRGCSLAMEDFLDAVGGG